MRAMRRFWFLAVVLVLRGASALSEDTVPRGAVSGEGDGGHKEVAKPESQETHVIHGMCYLARCIKGHWDVRWKHGCRTSLLHHGHRLHPPRGACDHPGS